MSARVVALRQVAPMLVGKMCCSAPGVGEMPPNLDLAHIDRLLEEITAPERRALRDIIAEGDLILVNGHAFLLARVSRRTIEVLAQFEVDREDLDDADREVDDEPEDEHDGEQTDDDF